MFWNQTTSLANKGIYLPPITSHYDKDPMVEMLVKLLAIMGEKICDHYEIVWLHYEITLEMRSEIQLRRFKRFSNTTLKH